MRPTTKKPTTTASVRTPASEGKAVERRDVTPKLFSNGRINYTLCNLRNYHDAIRKQLAKSDPDKRIRYLRKEEQAITLKDLMDLGMNCDREVGLYLDTYKLDPTKANTDKNSQNKRYTALCLFASDSRNYKTSRTGASAVGAAIRYPKNDSKRYRIIAHFHPTKSAAASQLKNDMALADSRLEMVVNAAGLIFFYKEAYCYNEKVFDVTGNAIYQGRIKDQSGDTALASLTINTPITEKLIHQLDQDQKQLDKTNLDRERAMLRAQLAKHTVFDTGRHTSPTRSSDSSDSESESECDDVDLFSHTF